MHEIIENTTKLLEIYIFFKNVLRGREVKTNFRKCDWSEYCIIMRRQNASGIWTSWGKAEGILTYW